LSDIFISYARDDRPLAEALAKDLQERGFSVWWDTELVASDNFQDVILAALSRAKAAIVIWTKLSVFSNFVRDEARYALFHNKLIATKAGELDVIDIPFGFQSQHTEDVLSRENIVRAIEKLSIKPVSKLAVATSSWEQIRASSDTSVLLSWIGRNPTHPYHSEAVDLVQKLLREPKSAGGVLTASEPIIRRGKIQAFLRGLTFQLPKFQLAAEGTWSSVGLAVTLWTISLSALYVWVGMAIFPASQPFWYMRPPYGLVFLFAHTLVAFVLSFAAMKRWSDQRNVTAMAITAPIILASCSGVSFLGLYYVFHHLLPDSVSDFVWYRFSEQEIYIVFALIGFALSVLYVMLKFRRVR
jgi:TIR domain-containing protein